VARRASSATPRADSTPPAGFSTPQLSSALATIAADFPPHKEEERIGDLRPECRVNSDFDDSFYEALHKARARRASSAWSTRCFAVVNDVTFDFAFEASDVATLWISALVAAITVAIAWFAVRRLGPRRRVAQGEA